MNSNPYAQLAARARAIQAAANPPKTAAVLPDPPKGFWDWAVDEWTSVVATAVVLGGLAVFAAYVILCAWLMGPWAIRKLVVARMEGSQ
jgi:hypothetical protein